MRHLVSLVTFFLLAGASSAPAAETMAPEIVVSNLDRNEFTPQVAYNSRHREYLVVWIDYHDGTPPHTRVLGRRIDHQGRPLADTFQISAELPEVRRLEPTVAYDPVRDIYLVVFSYDYYGTGADWDVRGRFLSWQGPDAALGPEFAVVASGAHEGAPAVASAWVSGRFLVAWNEGAMGEESIVGALLTPPPDSVTTVFPLASHATENRANPTLAYQVFGDNFLVVYDNWVDVFGRMVTASGSVGPEIAIAGWPDPESAPAVATCDNNQFLVTWQSELPSGDIDLYARFLLGDGTLSGAPIHLAPTSVDERSADVQCLGPGSDYLVVFEQQYSSSTGPTGISGQRLRSTGEVRPAFQIRPIYAGESGNSGMPSVAGSPSGWFASWIQRRADGTWVDIHGRAVWELFAEGFEWGDLELWSSRTP